MLRQSVRLALFVGAIAAAAVSSARAEDKAPCAPAMRTIHVVECVPETYKVKRTVYRVECKTEQFEATKCEMVAEQRTRECVVVKCVPVTTTEKRKVCRNVNVCEERTVMKSCWKTVTETCMKKRLVRLGHWECHETEACLANLFHKCCSNPCDPCGSACCAPKTRTVKRWVCCPEYECCPVTVCKKVCVQVPTVCKVNVCKQVWEEVDVQVCSYRRVEEKRTVTETVCVPKTTKYMATRTVRVCVPHEEEVTCCRMVRRCVERQVPCAPVCCPTSCCNPCDSCCEGHGLFSRLRGHGSCCR
ncbi:MAG: hypothetical protein U0793_11780 [Gemmataceae bacterium]